MVDKEVDFFMAIKNYKFFMVDKEFVRFLYIMKNNSGPLPHPVRCFFS
jgi:hypothetical protein